MSKNIRLGAKAKQIYTGYMPIDLPQHRKRNPIKPWYKVVGRPRVTIYPPQDEEPYAENLEYPPLNDVYPRKYGENDRRQRRLGWYDQLKSMPTFTEKMDEITQQGCHLTAMFNNWMSSYNSLPLIQYMTNTLLIDELPKNYDISSKSADDRDDLIVEQTKGILLSQIATEKYQTHKSYPAFIPSPIRDGNRNSYISNRLIQSIVSNLRKSLALEANPQLINYSYDLSPSIRSWFYHSGFVAPNNKDYYKSRRDEDGKINTTIQIDGSSAINLRHNCLIEPILSKTDPLVTDTSLIEQYSYPLREFGARYVFKYPVALPGFWPEDVPKFDMPHTSFLSMDCLKLRETKQKFGVVRPLIDDETCLVGQAILTAFGWTNGLSMYHGFTPYHEITYPFTCQVVTTNGQDWLFNVYQLNCHTFHRDLGGPGSNNICWSSGKLRLYDDFVDGQFIGVNDDVVKLVIRFLSQKTSPEYTAQLKLRPYLGEGKLSDEEKLGSDNRLREKFEQRKNTWALHDWNVPLWEHIFFRSKQNRHRITHMKPRWHTPKPKPSKFLD